MEDAYITWFGQTEFLVSVVIDTDGRIFTFDEYYGDTVDGLDFKHPQGVRVKKDFNNPMSMYNLIDNNLKKEIIGWIMQ